MSNSSFTIRRASTQDIPHIEHLSVAAYLEYRDVVPRALYDAYMQDLRNLGRYWDESEVFVADVSGEIAGSVLFYADASTEGLGLPSAWAGFRKLAVHPSARGRGIAKALVDRCAELAADRRAKAVGIHTASFMRAAYHVYEQTGFERCPQYDLSASAILGVGTGSEDIAIIAYRLDLEHD